MTFRFASAITMGNASTSLADLVRAVDGGETTVELDALAHSDSSAVAVLLAALRHARTGNRTLRVTGAPATLVSLAKLYGVEDLIGA